MALAETISEPSLKAAVQAKTEQVRTNCEFAREWRNKRLAHTDLLNLREGQASALPAVTITNVENALESIRDLLSSVENHYRLPPVLSSHDPWGARPLVYHLKEADRAICAERQRWNDLATKA
jgi:hypothetical protein